jgi:phage gpG-like protein
VIGKGSVMMLLNGVRMTGAGVERRFRERAQETKQAVVIANKRASIVLYQWVLRNFQTEGGQVGGWEPLAPATVEWKEAHGYSRLLQNTGALRASFLPYSDDKVALVGSPLAYSAAHEEGTSRVPQRRLLPNAEEAQAMVMPIYGRQMQIVTGRPL